MVYDKIVIMVAVCGQCIVFNKNIYYYYYYVIEYIMRLKVSCERQWFKSPITC